MLISPVRPCFATSALLGVLLSAVAYPSDATSSLLVDAGVHGAYSSQSCSISFTSQGGAGSYCPSPAGYGGTIFGSPGVTVEETYDPGAQGAADAIAEADPHGSLQVAADTDPGDSATGEAVISDVLHVTVAGAGPATVTELIFDVGVQALEVGQSSSGVSAYYAFSAQGNDGLGGFTYSDLQQGLRAAPLVTTTPGDMVEFEMNGAGASVATYIIGANVDVSVHSQLSCNLDTPSNDAACSASGGAVDGYSYGLVAQPGVTFTCDSLDFPSVSPSSAAPEPAAWMLAMGGLSGVGGAIRVRRRSPHLA